MTLTAVTARRARPSTGWNPKQLAGVTFWAHTPDAATGSPGSSVSSLTDRIGSLALTQATGATQPTVSSTTTNGVRGLTFTASQYLASASRGSIPVSGTFTIWVVSKATTTDANNFLFEVSSGSTDGWNCARKSGHPDLTTPGLQDYTATNYTQGTGSTEWIGATFSGADNSATLHKNGIGASAYQKVTGAAAPGAGANRVTLGNSQTFGGTLGHVGDIYDVIVTTGTPTQKEHWQMALWLNRTYGITVSGPWNAATSATTPSADASGTCAEHAVLDSGSGGTAYNGQRYMLGFVPLGSGLASNENPSINFSNDGNTWSQAGVTNPVVAYPGGGAAGNNADPCLLDNTARDGKIYLYYVRENTTPLGSGGVFYKTSTNGGTTWSAETQMLTQTAGGAGSDQWLEPKVVYDAASGQYWLWYFDESGGPPVSGFYRMTASSPTGTWSAPVACTLPLPGGKTPWHWGTPNKVNGKWVSGTSDSATARNMWLISTTDGLAWNVGPIPILFGGSGMANRFDRGMFYRLQVIDDGNGTSMTAWYIGTIDTGTTSSNYLLSQKISLPQYVLP